MVFGIDLIYKKLSGAVESQCIVKSEFRHYAKAKLRKFRRNSNIFFVGQFQFDNFIKDLFRKGRTTRRPYKLRSKKFPSFKWQLANQKFSQNISTQIAGCCGNLETSREI